MGLTSKVLNAIVEDVSQLFDLLLDSRKTTAKASLVSATSIPFRSEHPDGDVATGRPDDGFET